MSSFNESRMTERYPLLALHDEEEEEQEEEEEDEEPEDDSTALAQQRPGQTARGKRRQRRSPGRSSFTSSAPPSTAGSWDPSAAPHLLDEPNQGQRRTQPLPAPLHKRHTEHALGRKKASHTSTPSPRKSNTYNLSRRTRSSGGLQRGRQKRLQQSHPNLTGGGDKRKVNAEEGGGEGEEIKEEDEDKHRRKEEKSGKESESDAEKRRSAYEELLALGGFKSSKDAYAQQPAFVPSTRKEPDLLAQTLQRLLTLFRRPRMTLKDTMLLSPWQKWKKYNRVPWKIFLHLFMFLVVVVQVLLIYVETSQYFYANQRVFHKVFLGVDSDTFRQELYTIDDTLEHISTTVLNYYNVDNITADKYPHVLTTSDGTKARAQGLLIPLEEIYGRSSNDSDDTDKTIQPVDMELILYERDFYNFNTSEPYGWTLATDDVETEEEEYELTLENPLGPFGTSNESAVQALFHRVVEIKLKFSLYNLDIGSLGPVPFLWSIEQTYSKTSGFVLANLVATKRVFYSEAKGLNPQILFTIFNCLTFGLAMLSALLDCKSCISRYKLYRMAKRQYLAIPEETRKDEGYPKWSELSFFDTKAQFFSLWVVFMIFTSCCLMTASVLGIFEELGKLSNIYYQLFQGLGALGVAVNILRYLEYGQNFYTLILSLQLSAPRIARFIISAFPIFFGFMLMGIIMFSPYSSRFQDFTSTGVTLFSLLNGDEIRSTFEELGVTYPIRTLPTIYLYVFVGLFITAILNIFIFIIEDSYHAAKASQRANQLKRLKGTSDGTVSIREPLFSQRDTQDVGTTGGSNAERFDIFRLFEILEREYNVDESDEEEDDDEDDDYVDSDADEPTSEDGTILSSTEKDKQDEADTGAQPPQKQEQSQQGEEEEEEEEEESEKDKEKPQRPTLVVSPSGGGFFDVQPHGNINSDPISLPVRPRYTQPPPSIGKGGVDPRRRPSSTTGVTTTASSTSTASASGDDTITPLAATVEERNRIIRMKQREMEEIRRIRERIRQMQKEKENMERAAAGSSGRFLQIREEGGSGNIDSRRYSGDATSPMERNLMDIDLKITYKKLKKDMQEIIISNQKEFEKEVTSAIAAVKQKHDAKLQRKLRKQVKKSFHHLSPSSIPLPSQPTQTTTRVARAASPASSSAGASASASSSSSTPTTNNNNGNNGNNNNNAANMV